MTKGIVGDEDRPVNVAKSTTGPASGCRGGRRRYSSNVTHSTLTMTAWLPLNHQLALHTYIRCPDSNLISSLSRFKVMPEMLGA